MTKTKQKRKELKLTRKQKLEGKEYYRMLKDKMPKKKRRGVHSAKKMLTELDIMNLAKRFPGSVDAKYVAGMNVQPLPTMTLHNGIAIESASPFGGAATAIDKEYLLIAWCPVLTSLIGQNIPGRLGGLVVGQSLSTAASFGPLSFDTASLGFDDKETYGTGFDTFGKHGMVWSAELSIQIVAPAANIIGKAWHGVIPIGSFYNDTGAITDITLAQMIRIAKSIEDIHAGPFHLQSAVCNNDLVFSHQHDITKLGEEFAGEYMEYIIIQRGAASINSNNIEYSLMCEVDANAVFWPRFDDAGAFNLMDTTPQDTKQQDIYNPFVTDPGVHITPQNVLSKTRDEIRDHIHNSVVSNAQHYITPGFVNDVITAGISATNPFLGLVAPQMSQNKGPAIYNPFGLRDEVPPVLVYPLTATTVYINQLQTINSHLPTQLDPEQLFSQLQDIIPKLKKLISKPIFQEREYVVKNPAYTPPDISQYISPSDAPVSVEALMALSSQGSVPDYFVSNQKLVLNSTDPADVYWDECYRYDLIHRNQLQGKDHITSQFTPVEDVAHLSISEILDLAGQYIPPLKFCEKSLEFLAGWSSDHSQGTEMSKWLTKFRSMYKPKISQEIQQLRDNFVKIIDQSRDSFLV